MQNFKVFCGCLGLLWCLLARADTVLTPVGLWHAYNDIGKETGYIRIYEQGGALRGVVERGLPTDREPTLHRL